MSEGSLFGRLFGAPSPDGVVDGGLDDQAWLRALLDVEAALARAGAGAGLIPAEAAAAIVEQCRPELFDVDSVGRRAVASATPIVPLLHDLVALVPPEARRYVHLGATSQDILDTAMVLIARRALDTIDADLAAVARTLAGLAERHRDTPQVGRTLLQHALPTRFGLVCAGWLVAVVEARTSMKRVRLRRLAIQYGGAVGTLASLRGRGLDVAELLARDLGLPAPTLPWHTDRGRIAELATSLGLVAGALGTIALDVTLLAQSDVGEVYETGEGVSSTMPHKRNPARAVLVTACAHRVPGLVATVLAGMPQEAQRAAGRWHAEWETVTDVLRLVVAAARHSRAMLDGLRVDERRMLRNLDAAGDVLMAESAAARLSDRLGRDRADAVIADAIRRSRDSGRSLADELPREVDGLDVGDVRAALDPMAYLGSAGELIDRALAAYESRDAARRHHEPSREGM